MQLKGKEFIGCGSGFPAVNRLTTGDTDRGWKAAPTIKSTPRILKLTRMHEGGNSVQILNVILNIF